MPNESDNPGPAPKAAAPEPSHVPPRGASQQIADEIDRWFGDHAIPNFYQRAKEDLKKRLAAL